MGTSCAWAARSGVRRSCFQFWGLPWIAAKLVGEARPLGVGRRADRPHLRRTHTAMSCSTLVLETGTPETATEGMAGRPYARVAA